MRIFSTFAVAAALTGCFALTNTDRFEQDEGCDLQLRLRNFTPHTDDRFEVALVRPFADAMADAMPDPMPPPKPILTARAVFEPLEETTLNLRMPRAVPANDDPARPPYRIDFFGDQDGTGTYTFPGDHSWSFADACGDGPEVFVHDINFVDLEAPQEVGNDLVVFTCDIAPEGPLEVRLTGLNLPGPTGGVEETRGVGLYRRDEAHTGPIRLPGLFDAGFDYRVEVYADANRNGAFDAGEDAWSFRYRADAPETMRECDGDGSRPSAPCVNVPLPVALPACINDMGQLQVSLGTLANMNRTTTLANLHGDGEPNAWLNFDPDDTGVATD